MKFRTIRYYIREAFRSIVTNRLMSVASIFTVTSCVLIVSVFFILGSHVSFFVQQLGDSIGLVVFVEDEATELDKTRLQMRIEQIPQVTAATYVSADDALQNLYERMDNLSFLDPRTLYPNPLRASFELELTDVAYQEQVFHALEGLMDYGIGSILRDEDLGRILATLADVVQVITVLLIFILGIVAIVIITNTINITVNSRRAEINIMKYVGATDWFIRWPFILEGILIGLIGSSIPVFITWFGHDRAVAALMGIQDLGFIQFLPRHIIFGQLVPFALGLGAIIGTIGSGVSVRRHLKV